LLRESTRAASHSGEPLNQANERKKIMEIIHISHAGPERRISVNGKVIQFEMHRYCGPVLIGRNGDPLNNQKPKHPFWHAVSMWAQQGERIEDGLCVWDHPPEDIAERIGGRHYKLVGQTEPRRGS
jgi:hypothetical protein